MHEITTSIEIDVPPGRVWLALIDFPAHARWNPFLRRIEGSPREGVRLKVFIQPVHGKGMTFRPTVVRVTPNRELRWRGYVLVPQLFSGEHYFVIDPLEHGRRSRFVQGERFTGVLVPLLRGSLERGTRLGFEAMNHALKSRLEGSLV